MDDPRYGTVAPDQLPTVALGPGVSARLLAGPLGGAVGPFQTVQPVQLVHFSLEPSATVTHAVPAGMDNAIVYTFTGSAEVSGAPLPLHTAARLDASDACVRELTLSAGAHGADVMLFAGKRLDQPIAWHGPFVMTTQEEIAKTIGEMRAGRFPPKRVPWDYRKLAAFPADHPARSGAH